MRSNEAAIGKLPTQFSGTFRGLEMPLGSERLFRRP